MKYIDDVNFHYELIISNGKGKLTPLAEKYIIMMANEMIKKFNYNEYQDYKDCLNSAILHMLSNWKKFDEVKYDSPFRYFSELCKRALAKQYTQLHNKELKRAFCISCSTSTNLPL